MKTWKRCAAAFTGAIVGFGAAACTHPAPLGDNSGFELGNLSGWEVSGDAFRVTSEQYVAKNRYYIRDGNFHAIGSKEKKGTLSAKFKVGAAGYASFLIGGKTDANTYAAIFDSDGKEVLRVGNEAYREDYDYFHRALVDLSDYAGKTLTLKVIDNSAEGWIHLDDVNFDMTTEERDDYEDEAELRLGNPNSRPSDGALAATIYSMMHSYEIDDANQRPSYHATGQVGWINDPNGFSYYNGAIQLFYQANPYSNAWGATHWGHVSSQDFVKWEYQKFALAPEYAHESIGCFSGSAIEYKDKYWLVYTACGADAQVQCVASSIDGIQFAKNPTPVIAKYPPNTDAQNVRDPKVWEKDGYVYMVVSAKNAKDSFSRLLLYRTDNMLDWRYRGEILHNDFGYGAEFGAMLECPDLFELDGRTVVLCSPQNCTGHRNKDSNVYIVGDLNYETAKLDNWSLAKDGVREIDNGLDFYAPQTMQMPDGRRVMIAWMSTWNRASVASERGYGYAGAMTFPRELSLKSGRLYQVPVRELEKYRKSPTQTSKTLAAQEGLDLGAGTCRDLTVEFDRVNGTSVSVFDDGEGSGMLLTYRDGKIYLDRTGACIDYYADNDLYMNAVCDVPADAARVKLRILLDRYSCEVFVCDGYSAMTATANPNESQTRAIVRAAAPVKIDAVNYQIEI